MNGTAPETTGRDQEDALPPEFSLAQATATAVIKVSPAARWACRETVVKEPYEGLTVKPKSCSVDEANYYKTCSLAAPGGECTGCFPVGTEPVPETTVSKVLHEDVVTGKRWYVTETTGPGCGGLLPLPTGPKDVGIFSKNRSGSGLSVDVPLWCGESIISEIWDYRVEDGILVSQRKNTSPQLNPFQVNKKNIACEDLVARCLAGDTTFFFLGQLNTLDCSAVVPTPTPTPPPECAKNNTVRDLTNAERLALINGIKKTKPFVDKAIEILGCWKTMSTSKGEFKEYFRRYFNNPLNATTAATAKAKLGAINQVIDALLKNLNTPAPTKVKTYLSGLCFGLGLDVQGIAVQYQGPDYTQTCLAECRVATPVPSPAVPCRTCDAAQGVSGTVGFRQDIFAADPEFVWKHALVIHEASHLILDDGTGAKTGDFGNKYCDKYSCKKRVPPDMAMNHADAYGKFATDINIQSMSCE